jgi:hypothetical protein
MSSGPAAEDPAATGPTARGAADLELDEAVAEALRERLPGVAHAAVAAITVEVPSYTGALTGPMREKIENAVKMALAGFLQLASRTEGSDPSTPLRPALDAAYGLGRGEARSGRSMDALLAAYRVGARVSWRELSRSGVAAGLPAETMAKFAELVFAYIDELSAASVSGHADELATTGRVRQAHLERLGRDLLAGRPTGVLVSRAERAEWPEPETLTAVLLPAPQLGGLLALLGAHTLHVRDDAQELGDAEEMSVLLVPDMHGSQREHLSRLLAGRQAVLGPAKPWTDVRTSYERARRAMTLGVGPDGSEPLDTEKHLSLLVLHADEEALADLRAAALAPLQSLRPASAERLAETLRSWLLHQGRRDDVAADLFVHAQTVRYRMGQLRELFGDRLDDPQAVLDLTIALSQGGPVRRRDP